MNTNFFRIFCDIAELDMFLLNQIKKFNKKKFVKGVHNKSKLNEKSRGNGDYKLYFEKKKNLKIWASNNKPVSYFEVFADDYQNIKH